MFGSQTFRKACVISAKAIAWVLYAAFLEYCVHSVTMYFLGEPNDEGESDTVFFTERDHNCWSHIISTRSCGESCSYSKIRKILQHMDKAKNSLDICVYSITSYDFALCILDAHRRGVNIRLVTDGYRIQGTGSQIRFLDSEGISIRRVQSGREMHHKFFVADKRTLVNCSFNWTMQALSGNSEDAVILSEREIVKKFLQHFDALWNVAVPLENNSEDELGRNTGVNPARLNNSTF